jgi:D-alanyl-D-alanine carboxypeptidase
MRYSEIKGVRRVGRAATCALALVSLVGLSAGLAATAQASSAPAPGLTAAVRADLAQYLRAQGAKDHFSALSVRVSYPGQRPDLAVSLGTTTYGGRTPVSNDALWQIGSNTKAVTSVVLLQLEAEGKLSINDPLGQWLPQYSAWRGVTIRQMLSMTSGIPDYTNTEAFVEAVQDAPSANVTAAQLIALVAGQKLGPATYAYSNTNYLLAQLIIERAEHDSYFHQVTRRILRPLGLDDTCFAPQTCSPRIASQLPAGYSMSTGLPALLAKPVPPLAVSWAQGAGGLVGSLDDMITWDRALYSGRELPTQQQKELTSLNSVTTSRPITTVTADDPVGFGLGVVQRTDPVTGVTWAYEGGTLGYRVLHVYFPHPGLVMAVAVNSAVDGDTDTLTTLADNVCRTLQTSQPH